MTTQTDVEQAFALLDGCEKSITYQAAWATFSAHYTALLARVDQQGLMIEALKASAHHFLFQKNRECCGGGVQSHPEEPPECCAQPIDDLDRFGKLATEIYNDLAK